MKQSTTIVNNNSGDKVVQIIIGKRKYVLFTIMHRILILIDMTTKNKPILLLNRAFRSYDLLTKFVNKITTIASLANNNDDFINSMDTYIDLNGAIKNDTTIEIIAIYKIILEDYKL